MISEHRFDQVKRVFSVRNNIKKPQPIKRRQLPAESIKKTHSSRQVLKRDLNSRRDILIKPLYKNTSFTSKSRSKSPSSVSPSITHKGLSERAIRAYTPSSSSIKQPTVLNLTPFRKLTSFSGSNKRFDFKMPRSQSRDNVTPYSYLMSPNLNDVLLRNSSCKKTTPRDRYNDMNKEETARFKGVELSSSDFNSITTPPDEIEIIASQSPFAKVIEPCLNSYLNLSSEEDKATKHKYDIITDSEKLVRISEVEPEPSYPDLDILGKPNRLHNLWRNFKDHKKFPIQLYNKEAVKIDRSRKQVILKRLVL